MRHIALRTALLCTLPVLLWVNVVRGQPSAVNDVDRQGAHPENPPVSLSVPLRGQDAITGLGGNLGVVARRYGMTAGRLRELLSRDHTLWVDTKGFLFHVDDAPTVTTPGPTNEPQSQITPAAPPFPTNQTFLLHSKPTSERVIYLDFDGHTVSGTAWMGGATIYAEPYDLDGISGFVDTEHESIQRTWQRVANDFAPFDVDVTTQEPPASDITRSDVGDTRFGTRVVFTDNNDGICTSCGGVAYVGVFNAYPNSSHDNYQPAWVFNENYNGPGRVEAESASHEVGHNLALSHDGQGSTTYYGGHGTGPTGWAPIMGVGYDKELTQWSKGEYIDATETQDDLAVMVSYGTPYSSDDYPIDFIGSNLSNVATLAGIISGAGFAINQPGNIEQNTDQDHFRFYTAGGGVRIVIGASPTYPVGSNLDAEISIVDTSNTVVAIANDSEALGASLSVSLAAGDYVLRVRPVGDTDPPPGYTAYGSLGYFDITGSIDDDDGDTIINVADLCPNTFNKQHKFEDDPLKVKETHIRAVPVTDLRTAINDFRTTKAGLPATAWDNLAIRQTEVRAAHIQQLRDSLNQAFTALSCTLPAYTTDTTITPKVTVIKAAHIEALRKAVNGKK